MKKVTVCILGISGILSSAGLIANDIHPANYRGNPLTLEAHWTSFTLPDLSGNPVLNLPSAYNVVDDADPGSVLFTGGPFSGSGDRPFIEMGFDQMTIFVPGWVTELPSSQVRIQITYTGLTPGFNPPVLGAIGGEKSGNPLVGSSLLGTFNDPEPPVVSIPGNIIDNTIVYDLELLPNPDWVSIHIGFTEPFLSQVDIDTISVPEPSIYAMALSLVAGVLIISRRLFSLRK